MKRFLIIRADASRKIGTGHLMRCLALGQAWKDVGGEVIFITSCQNESLLERLRQENFDIQLLENSYPDPDDWKYTIEILKSYPDAWFVLDGYHFSEEYQLKAKETGNRLLVIDDMAHLKHYYADIILNQNLHANEGLYENREPYTKLLLGTKYVLLRREFLKWCGWKREIPEVAHKVLVTLGGADPDNVTLKIVQSLQLVYIEGLEAVVVVGASNPHLEELRSAVQDSSIPIRLKSNVTNIPELMAWADMAVSASGSTCWELAFMGLPSLVIVLAPNQQPIAEELNVTGAAVNLGWYSDLSPTEIAQVLSHLVLEEKLRVGMAHHARKLLDRNGVFNILKKLDGYWLSAGESI